MHVFVLVALLFTICHKTQTIPLEKLAKLFCAYTTENIPMHSVGRNCKVWLKGKITSQTQLRLYFRTLV